MLKSLDQTFISAITGIFQAFIGLYILTTQRAIRDNIRYTLVSYTLFALLWHIGLVAWRMALPDPVPWLRWAHLSAYGLVVLALCFWLFTRAFLHLSLRQWLGWTVALLGLVSAILLGTALVSVPPDIMATLQTASRGWIVPDNLYFVISLSTAGLLLGLCLWTANRVRLQNELQAHRNRITYLMIAILMLGPGYGMYSTLINPVWQLGLIVNAIALTILGYASTTEDLLNLDTSTRRLVNLLITLLVSIGTYVIGIYVSQLILISYVTITLPIDQQLLSAIMSAILLTLIYTPIRNVIRKLTNRLIFGQFYDYRRAIQQYSQATNNIRYVSSLADTVFAHVSDLMGTDRVSLWVVVDETDTHYALQNVSSHRNGQRAQISLSKATVLLSQFQHQQALAQYNIDISSQFEEIPQAERAQLKSLGYEWYIPVLKQTQFMGFLGLGPKKSGRPYNPGDLNLLGTIADQTALALENATLFDQINQNLNETTRIKNLMDNIFTSVGSGIITMDTQNKIVVFNRAAEKMLNTQAADCVGQAYDEAIPALSGTVLPLLTRNVLEREDSYTNYDIEVNLDDQHPVYLRMSLSPLKDAQNKIQGVAIVLDDETENRKLRAVRDMFRRYVSPAVVDRLPNSPAELQLGGQRQEVSVLFADIRGFTPFSEVLDPEELFDVLNQYLSMAGTSILLFEGTLDKFMGDAVMGIFNAPLEQHDHVLRAVRAAEHMQRSIHEYHEKTGQTSALQFGVGIHVGEAVVGNIGMSDRMDYTAIGDTVNLAKRLQENTPGGKILISEAVYECVQDNIQAIFFEDMQVKGRGQSVKTYELRYDA